MLQAARLLLLLVALQLPAAAQEFTQAPDPTELAALPPPAIPGGWQTRTGLHAKIHSHPRDAGTAQVLLDHAEVSIPAIGKRLSIPTGHVMDIYLADTEERFFTLQPGNAPDWADGTAWPHRGLIFLKSPNARPGTASPLPQVLDHEIVHVLLGRAFGERPVPRWLQEGLAQWIAGEYDPEVVRRIGAGMLRSGLMNIDDLTTGFPADPVRANLAYAQSADLIAYMVGTYGEGVLDDLILRLARGEPVPAAFRHSTGHSMDVIDTAWRDRLEESGLWLEALTSDNTFWGLAAVIFLVAAFSVRRRNKTRLTRWAEEEALQDALVQSLSGAPDPETTPWTHPIPPD